MREREGEGKGECVQSVITRFSPPFFNSCYYMLHSFSYTFSAPKQNKIKTHTHTHTRYRDVRVVSLRRAVNNTCHRLKAKYLLRWAHRSCDNWVAQHRVLGVVQCFYKAIRRRDFRRYA